MSRKLRIYIQEEDSRHAKQVKQGMQNKWNKQNLRLLLQRKR